MTVIGKGGHCRALGLDPKEAITSDRWEPTAQPVIVAIGDNAARKVVVEMVEADGGRVAPWVVPIPSMEYSRGIHMGVGVTVVHGAVVGKHVILNTGCIVEHGCSIGDYAHIGPGAVLCGTVTVGEGALVGANATVLPGLTIGAWAVVGAGAVVTKDVPAGETWVGNPAAPQAKWLRARMFAPFDENGDPA